MTDDPVVAAWRGLLIAHSRLVPAVEGDLRAAGQVPLSWYDVLLELNAAPDRKLRMSELGQRAVLSRTRVSRVVDELVAAGLAERQPDATDGRSSFAALTAAGREALRKAWPVYREAIHQRLGARLTREQCRELAALLELVIAWSDIGLPGKASRPGTGPTRTRITNVSRDLEPPLPHKKGTESHSLQRPELYLCPLWY